MEGLKVENATKKEASMKKASGDSKKIKTEGFETKKNPIMVEKLEVNFEALLDLEDSFSKCVKKLHFMRNILVEDITSFHEDALDGLAFIFCETHDQLIDVYEKFCSLHRIA